ncbi:molecular chaperone DnaJ [Gordonibacter massiliensis (ex Traore et al. 2017)]|uniref:Chaperone protein DnaJ n=1 Tax=Gordonibacter massiliensis (ex Traore et al. 2017) TaxID=1841863 RepID=A0A842JE22_9ACTN|nr:molecular chaperone DnaJ [Gordonibacter massiliensis (ex Traore et al. 2017)]MBC2890522.1 molecular chaperone DnaJ [Gordonibacter massiliensis (ex Traore et al. 2017)]MBX9034751.1 molecular chaperone DnaJ [Gordonibacter massiliensis (ex Traore et al. 2017)]
MAKDLYEVLGVSKNATEDEIKKAFRRRARELHPDVNKAADAEDQFKELNEAYDVLSDPGKRAQYDRFGTVPGAAGGGSPYGGGYVDFEDLFGGGFGMGDIFSSFFGGGGARQAQRREGRDMGVGLRVTLEEVAAGAKKEIVYDRLAPCPDCDGTGLGPDGREVTCPECGGQGRVVTVQHTFLGDMQSATTCKKCGGTGRSVENPCPECEGQGRVPDRQRVTVEVPVGIRDSQQLRLSGFGEAGLQGAAPGDLIVTVRVQPHEFFERDGDSLHARANVSIVQATLGAEIEIDGIFEDEKVQVRIPEGCQNEQVVRVKGHGMPKFRSDARGDLFVHVNVVVPKKVTKKQRELLEQLAADMGEDVPDERTPLQKLRDAFQ